MTGLLNIAAGGVTEDYLIENSCRFDNGDSPWMSRTPTAGNQKTWTFSGWFKRGNLTGGVMTFFSSDDGSSSNRTALGWSALEEWEVAMISSSQTNAVWSTSELARDPAAWYHFVCALDTTESTAADRLKLYVNGERITSFRQSPAIDLNGDYDMNSSGGKMVVGRRDYATDRYYDGYLAEVYFIDGQALDASSFGELDSTTNQWKPIDASGDLTFGTNGFYMKFGNTQSAENMVDDSPKTTSTTTFTTTSAITCDVLLVGGGGGGGNKGGAGSGGCGGGGGAGGFRTVTGLALGSGTAHDIMVGFGGGGGLSGYRMQPESVDNAGSQSAWGQGHTGGPSGFGDYVVDGGGGGGTQDVGARPYAKWAKYTWSQGTFAGMVPLTGSAGGGGTEAYGTEGGAYGNNGGNYPTRPSPGSGTGGGGGAGAIGSPGLPSWQSTAGAGGNGSTNAFKTGSNITYAGGGGGGFGGNGNPGGNGAGGSGGGGAGSTGGAGAQGTNGLGGGGGGGGNQSSSGTGSGGTGVVIVRYLANSAQATGGTITTYGSGGSQYYVHTFDTVNTRPIHNLTLRGDVKQSDAQSKVGTSSIYFDGASYDYIYLVTNTQQIGGTTSAVDDFMYPAGTAFCYEYWVRPTSVSGTRYHLSNFALSSGSGGSGSGNNVELGIYQSGTDLRVRIDDTDRISGVASVAINTWYHVAVTRNTSNVVTLWVNGSSVGTYTAAHQVGETRSQIYIGSRYKSASGGSGANEFQGFIDEIRISNTVRHTSTFTPSTTAYIADANTLLLIHSGWGGGLGADSSGQNNSYATTGLEATDQMLDTPTTNFATLNSLAQGYNNYLGGGTVTFSEGNLKNYNQYGATSWPATIELPTTGKWYWEAYADANSIKFGLQMQGNTRDGWTKAYIYGGSGVEYPLGTILGGTYYTSGKLLGFAVNLDDGEIKFYLNGVLEYTGTNMNSLGYDFLRPVFYHTDGSEIWVNFGSDSSFAGTKTGGIGAQDDNEKGDFYYTPPTGHLALCQPNLPDPSIALPTENFNTILWSGAQSGSSAPDRSLTGVGFQPDLVWSKTRVGANQHNLQDSVRTLADSINSDQTAAAGDTKSSGYLASLDSDGFTSTAGASGVVNWDESGRTYVAWNWKGGGAPTAPNTETTGVMTSGSVFQNGASNTSFTPGSTIYPTKISANTTAGFSIVTWTGTGSNATVAHGLSTAPELILAKNTYGAASWPVGATPVGWTYWMNLNKTDAASLSASQSWNNTAPSASVFSIGTLDNINASTQTYVAYCFHSVEGYSQIGSFVGNQIVDGTFIYTGFKPAMIIMKKYSAAGNNWYIFDSARNPYNVIGYELYPDESTAGNVQYTNLDFVSNGVKLRNSYSSYNGSGASMLYIAFAESPFKTSTAR